MVWHRRSGRVVSDEGARTFPIMREWGHGTMNVPWGFVEPFRDAIERNHRQTLERLAERGGLSPVELFVAAHGITVAPADWPDERVALGWLDVEHGVTP